MKDTHKRNVKRVTTMLSHVSGKSNKDGRSYAGRRDAVSREHELTKSD